MSRLRKWPTGSLPQRSWSRKRCQTIASSQIVAKGCWFLGFGLPLFIYLFIVSVSAAEFPPDGVEFFEKRIRPVLVERCYKCHSARSEKLKGELRLDSRDGAPQGRRVGQARCGAGRAGEKPAPRSGALR